MRGRSIPLANGQLQQYADGQESQRQSIAQVCGPFSLHTKQHHECYRCS